MNKFGERLKELREEKNLSMSMLAKELGLKSHVQILRWETKSQSPNIDMIIALATFFGCTADYLIGMEN